MLFIVLLGLAAMVAAILLVVVAACAVAGASVGAALGGTLPWIGYRPAAGKIDPAAHVFGYALRGALGLVGGGLLGGLAGIGVAVLAIWALAVFG